MKLLSIIPRTPDKIYHFKTISLLSIKSLLDLIKCWSASAGWPGLKHELRPHTSNISNQFRIIYINSLELHLIMIKIFHWHSKSGLLIFTSLHSPKSKCEVLKIVIGFSLQSKEIDTIYFGTETQVISEHNFLYIKLCAKKHVWFF